MEDQKSGGKAKKRLLIVEDHPVMRRGLAAWFRKRGRWEVLAPAASLEEAAALFGIGAVKKGGDEPEILLLDLQLEKGWGLDLLPRLRDIPGGPPPCVVYSAFDDWAHINAALSAGARGYVSKKSGEAELERALLAVLAGKEYVEKSLGENLDRVRSILDCLTRRETEVWNLAREGLSSRRIGSELGISPRTVDNILSIVYDKTGIADRKELMKL
jgi:NarL family two-component system response regulator LiaR